MRRRRRAGRADGLLDDLAGDVAGSERADRPTFRDRQERRGREQVLLRRADHLGGRRRRGVPGDAADQRGRDTGGLAHHEPARRGHLVGERDHRGLEHAPVVVGRAAQVLERREAGAADRDVHHAAAPRAAERVRDDDREPRAEPFRERRAQALGRGVRVLGQQRQEPGLHVRRVDAGVRAHQPVACLRDHEVATPGDDAPRLACDPRRAILALGDHAPLGLRHDLLGHRHDVAVANAEPLERFREERGEVVARANLGHALDRVDLDRGAAHATRSSAKRASASARASSVITVSVTPTRTPVAAIRFESARSTSSITHAPRRPR